MMIAHFGIPRNRADDLAIHPPVDVPGVFANDTAGHHNGDPRNGGAHAADIVVGNPVFEQGTGAARDFHFLGWFDAGENDVLAAEVLDLLLRLGTGAFANG